MLAAGETYEWRKKLIKETWKWSNSKLKKEKKSLLKKKWSDSLQLFSFVHYGEKQILNYFSGILFWVCIIHWFYWILYSHDFFGTKFMTSPHNSSHNRIVPIKLYCWYLLFVSIFFSDLNITQRDIPWIHGLEDFDL